MKNFITILFIFILFGTSLLGQGPGTCSSVTILTQKGGTTQVQGLPSGWSQVPGLRHRILNEYVEEYLPSANYRGGQSDIWYSTSNYSGSVTMTAKGRLGGCVRKTSDFENYSSSLKIAELIPREGVIGGREILIGEASASEFLPPDLDCNSSDLEQTLPAPCPNLASSLLLVGADSSINSSVIDNPNSDYYDTCRDTNNNPPIDLITNGRETRFDGQNVLMLFHAEVTFDWEDADLLIGGETTEGNFPSPGHGAGGAYANFHYAVMPYQQEHLENYHTFLLGLDSTGEEDLEPGTLAREANNLLKCATPDDDRYRSYCTTRRIQAYEALQYLLHLGDGTAENPPSVYRHALLPGPFWTKRAGEYDQCEWLDTRYQAPRQNLGYKNFGVWDWDDSPPEIGSEGPCISMILFEGDSGQHSFAGVFGTPVGVLLHDFIGFYRVCRPNTTGTGYYGIPTLYEGENFSGDVTLKFHSGDSTCTE